MSHLYVPNLCFIPLHFCIHLHCAFKIVIFLVLSDTWYFCSGTPGLLPSLSPVRCHLASPPAPSSAVLSKTLHVSTLQGGSSAERSRPAQSHSVHFACVKCVSMTVVDRNTLLLFPFFIFMVNFSKCVTFNHQLMLALALISQEFNQTRTLQVNLQCQPYRFLKFQDKVNLFTPKTKSNNFSSTLTLLGTLTLQQRFFGVPLCQLIMYCVLGAKKTLAMVALGGFLKKFVQQQQPASV